MYLGIKGRDLVQWRHHVEQWEQIQTRHRAAPHEQFSNDRPRRAEGPREEHQERRTIRIMASAAQEPEVMLAQRLAANEKSTRTKALKTFRKYLSVRSQRTEGKPERSMFSLCVGEETWGFSFVLKC